MGERTEFPFPQANDFDKVIAILNVKDEEKLNDKTAIGFLLGDISERQVQYYVSACQYLGLVTSDKKFTDLGDTIRSLGESEQIIRLAMIVVSKDVFGKTYFAEKLFGYKYKVDDIVEIMRDYNLGFESDIIYKRRAQTVLSWVEWLNEKFDNK